MLPSPWCYTGSSTGTTLTDSVSSELNAESVAQVTALKNMKCHTENKLTVQVHKTWRDSWSPISWDWGKVFKQELIHMETTYPGSACSFTLIQGTKKWTIFYINTEFSHKNHITTLNSQRNCLNRIYRLKKILISKQVLSVEEHKHSFKGFLSEVSILIYIGI